MKSVRNGESSKAASRRLMFMYFLLPHQGDILGSGGDVAAVVAAAVAPALLASFVPGRLNQLLRLGLQQFVEGFLHAASRQLFKLSLDNFLV